MSQNLETELAQLPERDRTKLCDLWKTHFGPSPPDKLRRDLMIPILAYRIQEQAFGSLKLASRDRLRQLAAGFVQGSFNLPKSKSGLKPGTRLIREWGNQVHLVNVEASGFEYKGGRYKSLSQIARLITGTRWSGPAFFGLKNDHSGTPNSKDAR